MAESRIYGVFIMTHGRPDKQFTYATLRRDNYTGPIKFVVDDEDPTIDQMKEKFGEENVCVFNKDDIMKNYDSFYNQPYRKTVAYARMSLYKFAKELGWTHFIMMDDDYRCINYKWSQPNENGISKCKGKSPKNLDQLFDAMLDLLEDTDADAVSFAQGGDLIGGTTSSGGSNLFKRKIMNSHFVRVDRPLTFRGFINEDVNLYVERPYNRFYFQTNRVIVIPPDWTKVTGGANEMYNALGTYVKSFMSVLCAPSCVKVKMMGIKNPRLHHCVDYKFCAPYIISEKWKRR